jgi:hypothetical protein
MMNSPFSKFYRIQSPLNFYIEFVKRLVSSMYFILTTVVSYIDG